ncbi:MAG: peptidylprolyl isomerase [Ignavibacteriae bacterium]|nr:peptidylprolyl isomerase [Ignavibacteriota bacterium]
MKTLSITALIATCAVLATTTTTAQTLIDRIVAVVDKEIITESELTERTTLVALQNRLTPSDPELRRQILDALIAEKLVLAQAFIDSVVVTDEEVSRELDQQVDNLIRRAGSQERLEQIYGMPLSRIKRESREIMRKQMLVSRVRQAKESSIQISRREVEEFFEEYKDSLETVPEEFELSHIFIKPKADTTVERQTRAVMTAILDSLRAGASFTDFAKRYSDDGSSAAGGDLGWAKRGDYVQEFEQALFSLRENQISDIVKTQFGFHIIQLIERRGESVHARHILKRIETGPASDSATVEFLNALRDSLQNGAVFSDLAKRYSEDEETKATGGDLGTVALDMLQPELANIVRDLQEGEVSQPQRVPQGSAYGYQIVKVKKRIPAHPPTLKSDYRRIEQIALQLKRAREGDEWMEDLKKNIYWEVRL